MSTPAESGGPPDAESGDAPEGATAEPPVRVERHGPDDAPAAVAVVRLNRPDTHNALSTDLKVALRDALEQVADDPEVRAVVLASSGTAFCVGQDLAEHAAALEADTASALTTVPEHYNRIAAALAGMPKPVVASIAGACVGAGLGFALACDLRIAAARSTFATAFAGIGLAADSGLSCSLTHAVGAARATELLVLGERFTAERAREWGLLREVVDSGIDATDAAAIALAERLAAGPTLAYAEIKQAVARGAVSGLRDVLEQEATAQARLAHSEDHRGAVTAFLAGRSPTFRGR